MEIRLCCDLRFATFFNLIAFGNVIKFSDSLDSRTPALCYLGIASALKLAGELILIVLMASFIRPVHVFMSLSVPVLGVTLLVACLTRCFRSGN